MQKPANPCLVWPSLLDVYLQSNCALGTPYASTFVSSTTIKASPPAPPFCYMYTAWVQAWQGRSPGLPDLTLVNPARPRDVPSPSASTALPRSILRSRKGMGRFLSSTPRPISSSLSFVSHAPILQVYNDEDLFVAFATASSMDPGMATRIQLANPGTYTLNTTQALSDANGPVNSICIEPDPGTVVSGPSS